MSVGIPISTQVEYRGQLYTVTRYSSYQRPDGKETQLIVWRTNCPECDIEFEFMTTFRDIQKIEFTRRCPAHAKAGKRVPYNPPRVRIVSLPQKDESQ